MKQYKKNVAITVLVLLLCVIMTESYAKTVFILQSYEQRTEKLQYIKEQLTAKGCPSSKLSFSMNSVPSYHHITWDKDGKNYIADVNLYQENGQLKMSYNIIGQVDQRPSEGTERKETEHTTGEIITESDSFISIGENSSPTIKEENLQNLSSTIYNMLLVVGIVLAVIIAAVLGIKFITGGVEGQVEVKKALVPYIIGCIVIFGAFAIWNIVLTILNGV